MGVARRREAGGGARRFRDLDPAGRDCFDIGASTGGLQTFCFRAAQRTSRPSTSAIRVASEDRRRSARYGRSRRPMRANSRRSVRADADRGRRELSFRSRSSCRRFAALARRRKIRSRVGKPQFEVGPERRKGHRPRRKCTLRPARRSRRWSTTRLATLGLIASPSRAATAIANHPSGGGSVHENRRLDLNARLKIERGSAHAAKASRAHRAGGVFVPATPARPIFAEVDGDRGRPRWCSKLARSSRRLSAALRRMRRLRRAQALRAPALSRLGEGSSSSTPCATPRWTRRSRNCRRAWREADVASSFTRAHAPRVRRSASCGRAPTRSSRSTHVRLLLRPGFRMRPPSR